MSDSGGIPVVELGGDGKDWKINGPSGPVRVRALRHLPEDEPVLLPHLPEGRTGRLLVALPEGAPLVPAVLAHLNPAARVEVFEMDLHDARLLRQKLAPLGNAAVVCASDPEPAADAAQGAVLLLRGFSDRLVVFDLIERLAMILPAGSPVWILVARKRSQDFQKKLQQHVRKLREVARDRDTLVLVGMTGGEADAWTPRVCAFEASTPATKITLRSRPGVFCHGRPDAGGIALAECLEAPPSARVLELGCGCGVTGLLLAQAWRDGGAPVTGRILMVDSHARAVEMAERNRVESGFPFVEVRLEDQLTPEPQAWDVVFGNPPYYAGHRIAAYFLDVAAAALRPGGRVFLVSKHAETVRELMEARGFSVTEEKRRRGYTVTTGVRN